MSLPYTSFVTAWLTLGLGEVPTALLPARAIRPAGFTLGEITERAWADLFERDLALGRQLDEGLASTLRVLAGAATRYYAFFHEGDGDTRSVLVAGSRVVATVDGGAVTLRVSWSDSGAQELVDLLPKVAKAPGEALSTPAGELSRVRYSGVLTEARPADSAARMRWVLGRPRTGGGQLYAARRRRDGRYQACAQPLSYLDTTAGRVIAAEHRSSDGTRWRSLIPADSPLLARRLAALLPGRGREQPSL